MIVERHTIEKVLKHYKEGLSVREYIQRTLETIEEKNQKIHAFVHIYSDLAIQKAKELDALTTVIGIEEAISRKSLFGVPFALKDNMLVSGLPMTAQSKILDGYIAPYSCDVYNQLVHAGAVFIGHCTMDEFALGSSNEYSGYGIIPKNPYDTSRVTGGSSGGPAAAVASGMVPFAIGSDTGGSVRQPASFCGIVGLRPTYGRFSRYGITAAASSLDTPGIFTNTVEDCETVARILSQPSENDSVHLQSTYKDVDVPNSLTIGWPSSFFSSLSNTLQKEFTSLKKAMMKKHSVIDIELPNTSYNISTYYLLMTVELASNLERYDGLRYGKNQSGELYFDTRDLGFGKEVKRRIALGTYASSAGYIDRFYLQSKAMRECIAQEFRSTFQSVDIIMSPVAPTTAFRFGEKMSENPVDMYLADIFTLSPALAGNTSISLPMITIKEKQNELPVGVQLIADAGKEEMLLQASKIIQAL